ncbi:MAG TPA: 30S ribosomal protein S21 [Terracidiphilus sp.]|nr:30S ribosomal protein S21 [Terracidiphilus sp.]
MRRFKGISRVPAGKNKLGHNGAKKGDFRYDKGAYKHVWRCNPLAEVRVQEGEPLENALRRFKRKVQTEDIIKEVKRHSYYLKPGEKRRVKAALARKRNRKKARKEQD